MKYLVYLFIITISIMSFRSYANDGDSNSLLVKIITKDNYNSLSTFLEETNKNGGLIILSSDLPKDTLPLIPNNNTRILDLRYNNGIHLVRGNHPRLIGHWPQYGGLKTGLGKNIIISDVLPYDMQVESATGEKIIPHENNKNLHQNSEEYSNTHNHYQNFLSEVWSFSPIVNAVSIWGDSGSFFPGSKSWGGFLSARSWPVHWQQFVPEGTPTFEDKDFDAQLVGLEIDVLNGGLPEGTISPIVGHPLAKSGLQIVGFGNRNTAAIEIRTEDSDDHSKSSDERKGTWRYGIIAYNSLNSDSTLLFSATPTGKTGIDLSQTIYSDSAIKINSTGTNTGLSFNNYTAGQIFSQNNKLIIEAGEKGIQLRAKNGSVIFDINDQGRISIKWYKLSPTYLCVFAFIIVLLIYMAIQLYLLKRTIRKIIKDTN